MLEWAVILLGPHNPEAATTLPIAPTLDTDPTPMGSRHTILHIQSSYESLHAGHAGKVSLFARS
jgi:hypothetical protein